MKIENYEQAKKLKMSSLLGHYQVSSAILLHQQLQVKLFFNKFSCSDKNFWQRL